MMIKIKLRKFGNNFLFTFLLEIENNIYKKNLKQIFKIIKMLNKKKFNKNKIFQFKKNINFISPNYKNSQNPV